MEDNKEYLDKYEDLLKILTDPVEIGDKKYNLKEDFEKFFIKGNMTAGTRIRKFMQIIRKSAEEIRKDVQSYKKSLS